MIREFNYYNPRSVEEAIELVMSRDGLTSILAGGTDLLVMMKKGLLQPEHVIDIKKIKELARLELNDMGLFIGAAVTVNELMEDQKVIRNYPLLVEAAKTLASHQIRNRATITGNICNASPGADMAPALLVLGTKVLISGPDGNRSIPLKDFFTGVKKTLLKRGEIVRGLQVEPPLPKGKGRYLKKSRIKGPDLSAVGVAGLVAKEAEVIRFAFGALAPTPLLFDASALFFKSKGDFTSKIEGLMAMVKKDLKPITDVRSTKEYRLKLAQVYTERILTGLWGEGEAI